MPLVSVIIPNFNHGIYLKERIDSVLNQTFEDFEVIILDDCSNDNSREIIEGYRTHLKITAIVYNDTNSGSTFKQWNKGVGLSSGKYVWIAESDDIASLGFLEDTMQLYKECSKVGLAYCQSNSINEKSKITGDWLHHTNVFNNSLWNTKFCLQGTEVVEKYLGFLNILPNASAILINKESYIQAGSADENFKLNGDWYLYIKILMAGYSIAYSPEKNNYFREHSSKVTRSAIIKGLNILEAYAILKFIVKQGKISSHAKASLIDFYEKSYLPTIFKKSVTIATLIKCLKIAFSLSFKPTLKIVSANFLAILIRTIRNI